MLLYEHPLSSYAQKVKIALREKGVAFTAQLPAGLGGGRDAPEFAVINPRLEVPVLVDGEDRIFDSTVILEYIEERWPDPALLPSMPGARAFARITEEVCDTHYEAVNWGYSEIIWFRRAKGELAERMKTEAARQTVVLQSWLTERLGGDPWFGGGQFGWADAAVAPMVNRSVYYGMGPKPGDALAQWHARLRERPSVAATFAEFDLAAAAMADIGDLYAKGGRKREYRDHRLEWMIRSGGLDIVVAGLNDDTIRFSWPD